jgi:hypothetical protein
MAVSVFVLILLANEVSYRVARSTAAIEEANAIGTAWLRTALLPGGLASETACLISDYVDLRLESASVSMTDLAERTVQLQDQLWQVVTADRQSLRTMIRL